MAGGAILAGVSMFSGCRTTQPRVHLSETDTIFQDGQYARALTDYQVSLRNGLNARDAEHARFHIGVCYTMMKRYSNAVDAFQEYLEKYPEGRYVMEAGEALQKIEQVLGEDQKRWAATYQALAADIKEGEAEAAANPKSLQAHYRLADLYWRAGRYLESAESYARVIRMNESYLTDPVLVYRVRVTDSGKVVPKVGSLGMDQSGNEGPLRVRTTTYRVASDFSDWSDRRSAVVSGTVQNTSARSYGPAQLQVNLLNLRGEILGSQKTGIGRLRGGESEGFLIEIPLSGEIRNVSRYECRLTYDW